MPNFRSAPLFNYLVLALISVQNTYGVPEIIDLGGIFRVRDWSEHHAQAAQLAVKDVNSNSSINSTFQFGVNVKDVSIVGAVSSADTVELKHCYFRKLMDGDLSASAAIAGPGYSSDIEVLSPIVTQKGIMLITHAASNPEFSNKTKHPNLARVCNTGNFEGLEMADLVFNLGYDAVKLVTCDDSYCKGLRDGFEMRAKLHNIQILETHMAYLSTFVNDANTRESFKNFVTGCERTRVIVLLLHGGKADEIFKIAKHFDVLEDTVWIACEDVAYTASFAPDGLFSIASRFEQSPGSLSVKNRMLGTVLDRPTQPSGEKWTMQDDEVFVSLAYDTVWSLALAFKSVMDSGLSWRNVSAVMSAMKSVKFDGASGIVSFDDNLDRKGGQYSVVNRADGEWRSIAVLDPASYMWAWDSDGLSRGTRWPGGRGKPEQTCFSQDIKIGGIFVNNWGVTSSEQAGAVAAQVAVEKINADPTILPGTKMSLEIVDIATVRILSSSNVYVEEMTEKDQEVMRQRHLEDVVEGLLMDGVCEAGRTDTLAMIGPGYSSESLLLQDTLAKHEIVSLSYSATSPELSNSQKYPYFGRTIIPDTHQGRALADLVRHFGWKRTWVVKCPDAYCDGLTEAFLEVLDPATEASVLEFEDFRFRMRTVLTDCSEARVIILIVHAAEALQLMKEAEEIDAQPLWLSSEAVVDVPVEALPQGFLSVFTGMDTSNGKLAEILDFWETESSIDREYLNVLATNPFVALAVDSVYALAHAFHSLVVAGGDPGNTTALIQFIRDVKFEGVTGRVSMTSAMDRAEGSYDIVNKQGDQLVTVARWTGGQLTQFADSLILPGNDDSDTVLCVSPSCPSGSVLENGTCVACEVNTYQVGSNCLYCPAGRWSGTREASSVATCRTLTYTWTISCASSLGFLAFLHVLLNWEEVISWIQFWIQVWGRIPIFHSPDMSSPATTNFLINKLLWFMFPILVLVFSVGFAAAGGALQGFIIAEIGTAVGSLFQTSSSTPTGPWVVVSLVYIAVFLITFICLLVLYQKLFNWPEGRYLCEFFDTEDFSRWALPSGENPASSKSNHTKRDSGCTVYLRVDLAGSRSSSQLRARAVSNWVSAVVQAKNIVVDVEEMVGAVQGFDQTTYRCEISGANATAAAAIRRGLNCQSKRTSSVSNVVPVDQWAAWSFADNTQHSPQLVASRQELLQVCEKFYIHPATIEIKEADPKVFLKKSGILHAVPEYLSRQYEFVEFLGYSYFQKSDLELSFRVRARTLDGNVGRQYFQGSKLTLYCSKFSQGFQDKQRSGPNVSKFEQNKALSQRLSQAQDSHRTTRVILPLEEGFTHDSLILRQNLPVYKWLFRKVGLSDRSIYFTLSPMPGILGDESFEHRTLQQQIDSGCQFEERRVISIGLSLGRLMESLHASGLIFCGLDAALVALDGLTDSSGQEHVSPVLVDHTCVQAAGNLRLLAPANRSEGGNEGAGQDHVNSPMEKVNGFQRTPSGREIFRLNSFRATRVHSSDGDDVFSRASSTNSHDDEALNSQHQAGVTGPPSPELTTKSRSSPFDGSDEGVPLKMGSPKQGRSGANLNSGGSRDVVFSRTPSGRAIFRRASWQSKKSLVDTPVKIAIKPSVLAPELLKHHETIKSEDTTSLQLKNKGYPDYKVDVYSLGVLMYRLLSAGSHPLPGMSDTSSAKELLSCASGLSDPAAVAEDRADMDALLMPFDKLYLRQIDAPSDDDHMTLLNNVEANGLVTQWLNVNVAFFKQIKQASSEEFKKLEKIVFGQESLIQFKLSQISQITLRDHHLVDAGINEKARLFAFCHPLAKDDHESLQFQLRQLQFGKELPVLAWLCSGAFVYFSADHHVVGIKAIDWTLENRILVNDCDRLLIGKSSLVPQKRLESLEGQWSPAPQEFQDKGFTELTWISPEEDYITGDKRPHNGAFIFKHQEPQRSRFYPIQLSWISWQDCPASPQLKTLVESMLHVDAVHRVSLSEVCRKLQVLEKGYDFYICYQQDHQAMALQLYYDLEAMGKHCFVEKICVEKDRRRDCLTALLSSRSLTFVPLLSGSLVGELKGYDYDIFLSYRVSSSSDYVSKIYDLLSQMTVIDGGSPRNLKVFYDKKCLVPGEGWEQEFVRAICNSKVVVPIVDVEDLSGAQVQNLTEKSGVDNVILEWDLAIELVDLGRVMKVFPVFLGKKQGQEFDGFEWRVLGRAPEVVLEGVKNKAMSYLTSVEMLRRRLNFASLGGKVPGNPPSLREGRSVRQTVSTIGKFQGFELKGEVEESLRQAATKIGQVAQDAINTNEVLPDDVLMQLQVASKLQDIGRLARIQPLLTTEVNTHRFKEFRGVVESDPAGRYQNRLWTVTADMSHQLLAHYGVDTTIEGSIGKVLTRFLDLSFWVLDEVPTLKNVGRGVRIQTVEGREVAKDLLRLGTKDSVKSSQEVLSRPFGIEPESGESVVSRHLQPLVSNAELVAVDIGSEIPAPMPQYASATSIASAQRA